MINATEIQAKIVTLRDKFISEEDKYRIDAAEKLLRTAINQKELAKRDEIKEILSKGEQEIREINFLLINDRKMTEKERDGLMREKDVHLFWLSRFDPKVADRAIAYIDETVDMKLNE